MPLPYRLARAALLLACLALAVALARRRPEARPVATALACYAAIDVARLAPLPVWLDAVAWCAWPGVVAALGWAVWRKST